MKRTEQIMGMPITVEVVGDDSRTQAAVQDAMAYFRWADEVFSTYKPKSVINQLARGELTLAEAPAEVAEVLDACERYRKLTGGYFDVVYDGSVDPSGLVKGWSIKNAAELIRRQGLRDFCLEAAGDIQTGGRNSQDEPWTVGIRHPTEHDKLAGLIKLPENYAIATSGTYERGAHIYNPHTGRPATKLVSLSVVGPDIYEADIYATAAFAMGRDGLAYLADHQFEGYQIDADHNVTLTPGFGRLAA